MFEKIKSAQIIDILKIKGGDLYLVGGIVRDYFLGKESKDIDIVVRNIPFEDLKSILGQYGKVDVVGESFGVLKYKDEEIELDIALPRVDKKIEGEFGHKAIEAQSNPFLPIKFDLLRRDFNFNAIAYSINDSEFVDPFGGVEDIRNKVVSCVDENAFAEDPLRILRALQMSLRFGFEVDKKTNDLIQKFSNRISELPKERILIELEKIVKANKWFIEIEATIDELNLFDVLFNNGFTRKKLLGDLRISTLEDLFYALLKINSEKQILELQKSFSLDNQTVKNLKAIVLFEKMQETEDIYFSAFKAMEISKTREILKSPFLLGNNGILIWLNSGLPFTINELNLNGNELQEIFGFVGSEIGTAKNLLIKAIFENDLENEKESLIKFLKNV